MEYTNLNVWMETRKLVSEVYDMTKLLPRDEAFGLISQINRAVVSIPSNIAEGCGRKHSKETIHFLYIARGSLYELETQIYLSLDQKYISNIIFQKLLRDILECKKLINGFLNYYTRLSKKLSTVNRQLTTDNYHPINEHHQSRKSE